MQTEAHIKELGIKLPDLPGPAGNYVHWVKTGNLLFLSGKGPIQRGWHPAQDWQSREGHHHRRGISAGPHGWPHVDHGDEGCGRGPGPRQACCQGTRHGELRSRLRRAAEGDQRLLGCLRRSLRRSWSPRSFSSRHGRTAWSDRSRDRSDRRGRVDRYVRSIAWPLSADFRTAATKSRKASSRAGSWMSVAWTAASTKPGASSGHQATSLVCLSPPEI